VKRDGVNKLVILPLYPQFSISTSGSSLRLLEAIFKSDPALQGLPHTVIPSWYQRRGYIVAQADLIEVPILCPSPAASRACPCRPVLLEIER
jgi:ferrochelatase